MRIRSFVVTLAFLALGRLFVACTSEVDAGDYCQDGWFHDYECPDGYVCDDSKGWTCQLLSP